ncbi:MAG: hypothetical protein IJ796_08675 [Lachnospiraceae bacterium]|nr:hypothetical protein [Lachnospiraceae bacterium]
MTVVNNVFSIFQILVVVVVIFLSARLVTRGNNVLLTVFFTFAFVSLLLSDLYWLTFDTLRYGMRMPIAANEIGEWAFFLLLATGLSSLKKEKAGASVPEMLYVILFTAVNTALWIIWSGEWLQDIMTGFAVGVLAVSIVRTAPKEGIPERPAGPVIAAVSTLVIAFQALSTYIGNPLTRVLEYVSYALMYLVLIYFVYMTVRRYRENKNPAAFTFSLIAFVWNVFTMYMSPGVVYFVSLITLTLILPLLYLTFRREVMKNDLC